MAHSTPASTQRQTPLWTVNRVNSFNERRTFSCRARYSQNYITEWKGTHDGNNIMGAVAGRSAGCSRVAAADRSLALCTRKLNGTRETPAFMVRRMSVRISRCGAASVTLEQRPSKLLPPPAPVCACVCVYVCAIEGMCVVEQLRRAQRRVHNECERTIVCVSNSLTHKMHSYSGTICCVGPYPYAARRATW